jgi:hypothetical protein
VESGHAVRPLRRRHAVQHANHRHRRLLRARRKRPRRSRAAEQRDELATGHRMTALANAFRAR